jgi:RNA ligase (TIGR02306 family)
MRHLVTVNKIEEIKPIEGADFIVAARVKGWWCVVKKDEFKVGDKVLYFEVDSFLPDIKEYEFLKRGSTLKRMIVDGEVKNGIRLKTVKLRKQVSQGLIMPIPVGLEIPEDGDVTEFLGVIKYEAPVPSCLSGTIKGYFPGFLRKTDEERIQNIPEILKQERKDLYVTEKVDGSSVTFYKKDGQFGVCSRNIELKEGESTQWLYAKEKDLANILPDNYAIQGEIVGEGINGNHLNIKGHKVFFFNVFDILKYKYLDFLDFTYFIKKLNLETVPILYDHDLYSLPKSLEEVLSLAEGKSVLNKNIEREGIVVRPLCEDTYKDERWSFKVISNKYLLNEK